MTTVDGLLESIEISSHALVVGPETAENDELALGDKAKPLAKIKTSGYVLKSRYLVSDKLTAHMKQRLLCCQSSR